MRNKISVFLKSLIFAASFFGVIWSFFNAQSDGYSHWSKRLLYFTSQSNIWIGLTCLSILLIPIIKPTQNNSRVKNMLYLLKYVFTVSITLTGFIFCAVLAPGAANDNYNAWTAASIMTHIIVPVLSVVDFFIDTYKVSILKRHIPLVALPPFAYMIFASALCVLKVDFGRGDPFPYFFFNYYSPAGFFGFSNEMPYVIGSFYWIVLMLGIIISVGALYRRLYNKR